MLIIGIHGIQPIHHVVFLFVGGGVTKGKQSVEFFQALLGLSALHALGLVNDEDGLGLGDDLDRPAAADSVRFFVNDPLVLAGVKRLHIDDHDVDGAVAGKAIYLGKPVGRIDEEADLLPVFFGEMFLRTLKGTIDALPNCHRRHHNDKFAPTIAGVELVHCFDVCIGLSSPGLHFNGQIDPRPR